MSLNNMLFLVLHFGELMWQRFKAIPFEMTINMITKHLEYMALYGAEIIFPPNFPFFCFCLKKKSYYIPITKNASLIPMALTVSPKC